MTTPPTRLGELTWPQVDALGADGITLLVPLGSTEQHGPHLPVDTDTRIAVALAARAAEGRPNVIVAPALPFGASGEHAGFAGTISIGTEALHLVLVELVRSLGPEVSQTVFVNGHGGNGQGLLRAIGQLQDEGHSCLGWWPKVPNGDAHAGRTETSLMLAIAPELVRVGDAAAGAIEPVGELMDRLRAEGLRSVTDNGVLGDPTGANAAEGEQLLVALTDDLRAAVCGAETATR